MLLGLLMAVVMVWSKTMTWSGLGTNNLWNNAANWSPYGIPQSVDDVVMTSVNVLVGSADGAKAASITATSCILEVRGCDMTTGTLTLKGTMFTVNAGAGTVEASQGVSIDSASKVEWTSGNIGGKWMNSGKMVAGTAGGGVLQCAQGGSFANEGSLTFANATQLLFACPVENSGSISFQHDPSLSSAQFIVNEFMVSSNSTGTVSLSGGPIQFKAVQLSNFAMMPKSTCSINLATASVTNFTVGDGAKVEIHQSQVTLESTMGAGTIEIDTGSTVTFTKAMNVGTVNVNAGTGIVSKTASVMKELNVMGGSGQFWFQGGDGQVDTLTTSQGTVSISKGNVVTATEVSVSNGDGFYVGGGVLKVQTLLLDHFTKIAVNITVGKAATITSNLAVDGMLEIPSGIELTIPAGQFPVWGPSNASAPGMLALEGTVMVSGNASLTMNSLVFEKDGAFKLSGKLDVQATTFRTSNVTLVNNAAVFQGEGATLNYGGLSGPSAGAKITLYTDRGMAQCTSPCPGQNQFYQSYKAYIA